MRKELIMVALGGFLRICKADGLEWQISNSNIVYQIACSADGKTLLAAGSFFATSNITSSFYVSTNSGITWAFNTAPFVDCSCLACSADGTKLAASALGQGFWTSTNSGVTWTARTVPSSNVLSVASSASGETLVFCTYDALLCSSTDGGGHWVTNDAPGGGVGVACSADGTKLFAAVLSGAILISTNSGDTWQATSAPSNHWGAIACSVNGMRVFAGTLGFSYSTNQFYLSTNSGASWTPFTFTNLPQRLVSLASSADGMRLMGLFGFPVYPSTPRLCVSVDGGITWTTTGPFVNWQSLASSADGYQLVALASPAPLTGTGSGVYISKSVPQPVLNINPTVTGSSLAWTIPSINLELQKTSDLGAGNWADVPGQPTIILSNLSYRLTLPPTTNQSFFRLRNY